MPVGLVHHFLCFLSSPFSLSMNADKMIHILVTYMYIAVECAVLDCTNLPFAVVDHHMVLGAGRLLEHFCLFVLA